MAKQGMSRPDWTKRPKHEVPPVPEIQGKAKHGKEHARPIIPGTEGPELKVYHALRGDGSVGDPTPEETKPRRVGDKPIPGVYAAIDNDLARDNLENHIPVADLEDL